MNDTLYTIALLSLISSVFSFIFYSFSSKRLSYIIGTISALAASFSLAGLLVNESLADTEPQVQLVANPAFYSLVILVTYFIAQSRLRIRGIGSFILPIALLTCLLAPFADKSQLYPAETVGSAYFLYTHIVLLIVSFTIFFVSFAIAIYYIIKLRALKSHRKSAINDDLPSLTRLQNAMVFTFKCSWFLMTVGLILSLLYSLKTNNTAAWTGSKEVWGMLAWSFDTALFFLYSFGRLSTRNLARSITALFIILLSFYSFLILKSPGESTTPAPSSEVRKA